MNYTVNSLARSASSLLLATAISLATTAIAHADVTLTAMFPFTKVDPDYARLQETYERFHAANPDITINFDYLDHDAYHNKMQALAISGNLPDILTLWPGKRTGYLTGRGYAKDLRDLIKRDGVDKLLRPVFTQAQAPTGEVYEIGVPYVNFTNVVYVNRKLLNEVKLDYPKTLGEMIGQSKAIRAAGYRPAVFGDQSSWVLQSCLLSVMVGRMGTPEWFANVLKGADGAAFTDAPFVGALKKIPEMVDAGFIDPSEPSTTREQALSAFVSGRSVYFIGGIWEVVNLTSALPPEMKADVEIRSLPEIEGAALANSDSSSGQPSTGFGMSAKLNDEKSEAAWKWIKFNLDPSNKDIDVKYGMLPIYAQDVGIGDMLSDPLAKKSYAFSSSIVHVLPVLDDRLDAEGVMQVVNAGLQELILGSVTPEELAAKYEAWVAANDSNRKPK